MKKALIVIDAQNDYLADGKFPLWNIDETVKNISDVISDYKKNGNPIIFIQHLSPAGAAFFDCESDGCGLIPELTQQNPDSFIITKQHGNAFDETGLDDLLISLHVDTIELCGMMTQNCVLFTAIAEEANKYELSVLSKCCTSVSPVIHAVALKGLSRIVKVL
ncbi:isochorismatase family protein [Morganella morganii]|nr:isochorismatase family protein [Morganella morganii]